MTMTALVVDDSRMIRLLATQILEDEGFEVMEAPGAETALDMLRTKPDVIVTDLNMPHMDGVRFVALLRAGDQCPNVPVVMVSGEHDDSLRRQAMAAGVDFWVDKPFTPLELLKAVGTAMLLRKSPSLETLASKGLPTAVNW